MTPVKESTMGDGYTYGPLSAVPFKVDPSVHWIQARKAWDDDTNWVEGTLATFEDDTAVVALRPLIAVPTAEDSDQTPSELVRGIFNIEVLPIDDLGPGETVWVNERWGVLAFADPDGNAIAIQQPTEMPESVFTQAWTRRLRFVSIQRSGDAEQIRGVLAYAVPRGHDDVDRFQIAPLEDIRYTVDVIAILNDCHTWGEVRGMANFDIYAELLSRAGVEVGIGLEVPADDDVFDPGVLYGVTAGEYPEMPNSMHNRCLPAAVRDKFTVSYETMLNGTFTEVLPDSGPAIVAEMEDRGWLCVKTPRLFTAELDRFEWMGRNI